MEKGLDSGGSVLQVNLCQKLFFLQKMGKYVHIKNNFCTQHVLPVFCKKNSF